MSSFAFIRSYKDKDNEAAIDQIVNSGKWFVELNNRADAQAIVNKVNKIIKENIYLYPSDINKIVKDLGYNNPVFYENDLLEEVRFNDSKISSIKDGTTWRVDFIPTKEIILFSTFAKIGFYKNKAIEIADTLNKKAANFGYFTKNEVVCEISRVAGQYIKDLSPDVDGNNKYYGCAVYEGYDGKYRIGYWDSDSKKMALNVLLGKVEGKKVYQND